MKKLLLLILLMTMVPSKSFAESDYQIGVGRITKVYNLYYGGKIVHQTIHYIDEEVGISQISVTEETYKHDNIIFANKENIITVYKPDETDKSRFPMQHYPKVVAKYDEEKSKIKFKISKFDSDYISSDGELKLNIHQGTRIRDLNDNIYEDTIENKTILVIYTITTKDIPRKTTPIKIIVLESEKEIELETTEQSSKQLPILR